MKVPFIDIDPTIPCANLDEAIAIMEEVSGMNLFQICMRGDLALALFGDEIPETYKRNKIVIDDEIDEIVDGDEFSSSIYILPLGVE